MFLKFSNLPNIFHLSPITPIISKFPINNRSCPLLPKPTIGRARNFARGKASGHIPRRGGGLGVGQAWNCLRQKAGVEVVISEIWVRLVC